jgi:hypothetical protein
VRFDSEYILDVDICFVVRIGGVSKSIMNCSDLKKKSRVLFYIHKILCLKNAT